MKCFRLLLVIAIGLLSTANVLAQSTDSTQLADTTKQLFLVTKTDGGQFYGYILKDDGREILLETKTIGKIYIAKSDIQSIVKVTDSDKFVSKDGTYKDYRNEGPFTTRYYLTTNALPIKKGENYAMIHLYGPEVHFAVSDNLSLGVMASWVASPIALAAKYSFNSKSNTHFAIGTIAGSSGFLLNGAGYGGLHWATVTKGDRRSNISFSAGYGYADLGLEYSNRYVGDLFTLDQSELIYDADKDFSDASRIKQNAALEKYSGVVNSPELKRPNTLRGAPMFSISGIKPVGKKASFIFDAMVLLPNFHTVAKEQTFVVPGVSYRYYDYNTQMEVNVTEDVLMNRNVAVTKGLQPTILVMPGMRFNNAHNKAFQIVLAGIITKNRDGDIITIPVPMVSWLRTF